MERLREVDALRGLAALSVALFVHFFHLTGVREAGPLAAWLPWLYRDGYLLVDLFFVLSGLTFAHVYLGRDMAPKPGVTARSFVVARIARLYPLHLTTLLAAAALIALAKPGDDYFSYYQPVTDARHFILSLLMLQGSDLAIHPSFNGPAWSLTAEVAAYAAFLAAVRFAPRRLLVVSALAIVIGLLGTRGDGPLFNWMISRGLAGFFVGCLLASAHAAITRLLLWPLALLAAAGVAILGRGSPLRPVIGPAGDAILLGWPALVAFALHPAASSRLSIRPLLWLGDLSYSIYLVHTPVHFALLLLWGGYLPPPLWPLGFAAAALLTLATAQLSFTYLETPSRHWLRRFARPALRPSSAPTG